MIADIIAWDFRMVLQDYLAWAIGISALLWGGGPERAVAVTWLALFQIAPWAWSYVDDGAHFAANVDVFFAVIDGAAAISWITIALFANRNYTLWIAAMQVLAVCAHMASGLAEPISPIGYGVMVIVPSWIQLFLMSLGLVRHVMRKRKHGEYRDWRISKTPQSFESGPRSDARFASLFKQGQATWRDEVR